MCRIGARGMGGTDGYWDREMGGLNFFLCNGRIRPGLAKGTGESGGHTGRRHLSGAVSV